MSIIEDLRARVRQKRPPIRLGRKDYRDLVRLVFARAGGICEEADAKGKRCNARADDPHHVVFRSQGGDDSAENMLALCRVDHAARHGIKIIVPSRIGGRE